MGLVTLNIPQSGQPNATEDAKVASDLTALGTLVNGAIDTLNLSPTAGITFAQLAPGALKLAYTPVSSPGTLPVGAFAVVGSSLITTLPAPVAGGVVAIQAGLAITGAAPVTVSSGGPSNIYGLGLAGVAGFFLGTANSSVVLASDGTNWSIIAGQQDSGWVALTLGNGAAAYTTGRPFPVPASRLRGDKVELCGAITVNGTNGTATITSAHRPPTGTQSIMLPDLHSAVASYQDIINGVMTFSGTPAILGLDQISYRIS